MAKGSNNAMWIVVVILAVCLQVAFVFADCKQSATDTAVDFSKAYFGLDADMDAYLCSDLIGEEGESVTGDYLYAKINDARERGFKESMVRQMITHIETRTIEQDETSARIHIAGESRTCIHPAFTYVAKIFQLGDVHEFEVELNLTKEDGKWKVCGTPYGLSLDG